MADQDINFRLNTEADTTGAEETTEALKDTRTEAQKLQAQRDVETVQRKQAEEEAKKEAEILREIADGQQRIVAANLAKAVGEISQQFKGLNPELDASLSGLNNFLTVYAASGNVYGAVGAVAAQSVGMVFDAIEAGNKIAHKGIDDMMQAGKALAEAMRNQAEETRKQNLEEYYQGQIDKLREQISLVERLNELQAAGRKTDAKVQDAISPAATPDAKVDRERDRGIEDVQARLAEAEAASEQAALLALTARANAQTVASAANIDQVELKAAQLEAEKAQGLAELAASKAEQLKAEAPLRIQEINAAAIEGYRAVAEESKRTIEEQARQALAEIQAVADANAGGGPGIQAVIQRITALVQGGIDEGEIKALEEALKLAQGTTTAIRTGLSQRLQDDIELVREIETANKSRDTETKNLIKEIMDHVRAHKSEIDILREQMKTIPRG